MKFFNQKNKDPIKLDPLICQPGDMIHFYDKKCKESYDTKGTNAIGILLDNNKILFSRKRRTIEEGISKDIYPAYLYSLKSNELREKIYKYFQSNKDNFQLFKLGLNSLNDEHMEVFNNPELMPKLHKWKSYNEYEIAWNRIISQMQKGDSIFTFNENSYISRFIAWFDNGSWSHVAIYVGNSEIAEAIAEGFVKRSITVYNQNQIHIGLYRLHRSDPAFVDGFVDSALSLAEIGSKYNYYGVLKLGLQKMFRLKQNAPSPSDIVYSGLLYLVDYI